MPEQRIARFVDIEACKHIFSDYSTFVLRSSEYYRRICETEKGDDQELRAELKDGGSAEMSGFVLSCWTMLDGDTPTPEEWKIFAKSVVAIVSTPSKVCTILEKAFEIGDQEMRGGRRSPFMSIRHKAIRYVDKVDDKITPDNILDLTVFTKRRLPRFTRQKEYRFALPLSMGPHMIDTYILAFNTPTDYMEKCIVNPELSKEDKKNLLLILWNAMAGYGHFSGKTMPEIIANTDDLF